MQKQPLRRLAIFAYFDAQGQVDDYVPYLLRAVRAFCEKQVIVVNGTLTEEGRAALRACCDELIQRPNEGFDITAYKEGFLRENAVAYDEVLFYNQTIFGPVCPLDEMFSRMEQADVDFWGLTRHKGAKAASWDDTIPIPPHIQSFFFAVRGKMLHSEEFLRYWQELPAINSYWDAVEKHEIRFTKHFAALGYRWDVAVHTEDLEALNDYPLMGMPVELLKERGCPFFKRKNFMTQRHIYTTCPQGAATKALYDYLRKETDYPTALVMQNLLRTEPLSSGMEALGLCVSADERPACDLDGVFTLVMIDHDALASLLVPRLDELAKGTVCRVVYANEHLRSAWDKQITIPHEAEETALSPAEYLMQHLADIQAKYRWLLFLHTALPPLLEQFADATSMLSAMEALHPAPCAAAMQQDENIGLIVPLTPSHQETLTIGLNLPRYESALREMGIKVPLGKWGIASRGGMFFARTDALSALILPENAMQGRNPLWDFVPPLLAQKNGFFTAFSTSHAHAVNEWLNKSVMLEEIQSLWATKEKTRYDQIEFRMKAILDFYYERRYHMTLQQAFEAPLTLKQKVWICLQIFMKPKTFERLQKLLGGKEKPAQELHDDLD